MAWGGRERTRGEYASAPMRRESEDAVQSGFTAKVCIHPTQVPVLLTAFIPSEQQLRWAGQVVAAAGQPGAHGVIAVEGRLVDEPVLRHARRIRSAGLALSQYTHDGSFG